MSVQQAGTDIRALRELEDFPLVEALFGRRSRRFARGGESRTGRWPTGPGTSRFRSASWSGWWSSAPWAGRRAGISRSPGTPATRRTSRAPRSTTRRSRPASPGQAQHIFDTFGKFPGTVPSVFIMNYVQAHHLDLDFYDRFFQPGAYLRTHAEHMQRWHGEGQEPAH